MSLFLGKIHYWLYDKIINFESIEKPILEWANKEGLPTDKWNEELGVYGERVGDKPLEEVVDTNNIHGSLQEKISAAEQRHAYLITSVLKEDNQYLEKLKEIFYEVGKKASGENVAQTPEDVYNLINNYVLEGMPCDHVNKILSSNSEELEYESTTCLHEEYWQRVGGNAENFYTLRDELLKGFVETLGYTYKRISDKKLKIIK